MIQGFMAQGFARLNITEGGGRRRLMLESPHVTSNEAQTTTLGVLDIGSNTIHMLVVDADPGSRPNPLEETKSTVRLMQYLKDDGSIGKRGVKAILDGVDKGMALARRRGIDRLLAMATSAIREASNGGKILRAIEKSIGQPVTVLSGDDEARLTFLAARRWYGWDAGRLLVLDIGGGSLDVAVGADERPESAFSVPVGAGRVTKKWLPDEVSAPGQLRKVHDKVREALLPRIESFPASTVPDLVAGTSKTFRSLARLTDSAANKEGPGRAMILDRAALEDWIPRIAAIAPDQRTLLPGITPERTLQIVGGAIVADEVMKAFDVDRLEICPWALR